MRHHKTHRHLHRQCPNCGQEITPKDRFCSQCGQSMHHVNIPLKHLLADALEDLLHFDGKSIQTVNALLLKPGQLTKDFLQGKRIRYVAPLRFYLFVSVLFFIVLAIPKGQQRPETQEEPPSQGINISFWGIRSSELKGVPPSQIDSVLAAHSVEQTTMNRYILRQMLRIQNTDRKEFSHTLVKGISYMMFVLMPVFGVYVFLLFKKAARQYIGSLIFSVHYHSFIFLLLALLMIFNRLEFLRWVPYLVLLISPSYLVFALRNVYGGSLGSVVLKTTLLGILHFASLAILFILTVALSLLLF